MAKSYRLHVFEFGWLGLENLTEFVVLGVSRVQIGERIGRLLAELLLGLGGRIFGDGGLDAVDGQPMGAQGHAHRDLGQRGRGQLCQVDFLEKTRGKRKV